MLHRWFPYWRLWCGGLPKLIKSLTLWRRWRYSCGGSTRALRRKLNFLTTRTHVRDNKRLEGCQEHRLRKFIVFTLNPCNDVSYTHVHYHIRLSTTADLNSFKTRTRKLAFLIPKTRVCLLTIRSRLTEYQTRGTEFHPQTVWNLN